MQDASEDLERALDDDEVAFAPVIEADWELDGFGGEGTLDDLSGQASNIRVTHGVTDGLPDEIAQLRSSPVPQLTADLSGGQAADGRDLSATQYWSPFSTASPLHGLTRDITVARASQGVLTDSGVQQVRLFTGLLQDTPTPANGKAKLEAISLTRLLLSQFVLPPLFFPTSSIQPLQNRVPDRDMTITWPVSWTLHHCGVLPSPPAQPGCRFWMPLHGGTIPFRDPFMTDEQAEAPIPTFGGTTGFLFSNSADGTSFPHWTIGPYVGAIDGDVQLDTNGDVTDYIQWGIITNQWGTIFNDLPDRRVEIGECSRVETYVRMDEIANLASISEDAISSINGSLWEYFLTFYTDSSNTTLVFSASFKVGVDRVVSLEVNDGTNQFTLTGPTLPEDGQWRHIGAAWSVLDKQLWLTVAGEQFTQVYSGMASIDFETVGGAGEGAGGAIPCAEFQLCCGDDAHPDANPWVNQTGWVQSAIVHPSFVGINGPLEAQPREAFEYITSWALTELAQVTINEHDQLEYRPVGAYATPDAQTLTETITTQRQAQIPSLSQSAGRVRNQVRVSYTDRPVLDVEIPALEWTQVLDIGPGSVTFRFSYDRPSAKGVTRGASNMPSFQQMLQKVSPLTAGEGDYVMFNREPDGSGAYEETFGTSPYAIITAVYGTSEIDITFTNETPFIWYVVSDDPLFPALRLVGGIPQASASVVEEYGPSIVERGTRALPVSLPQLTSPTEASRIARRILAAAARPTILVDDVEVFGNPRRQIGDLVRLTDTDETGVDALFRTTKIEHKATAGKYTQQIQMRQARQTGRWGDGVTRWGSAIWTSPGRAGIDGE